MEEKKEKKELDFQNGIYCSLHDNLFINSLLKRYFIIRYFVVSLWHPCGHCIKREGLAMKT